jgi:8-oxo-dGTP diphosphatase
MTNRIVSIAPNQHLYAADMILTRGNKLLLIERGYQPYAGLLALPGGRIDTKDVRNTLNRLPANCPHRALIVEYAKTAALREASEEVGLQLEENQVKYVLTVTRDTTVDPRGSTTTFVFHCEVDEKYKPTAGDDAASYKWVTINKLKKDNMAFDHYQIVQEWLLHNP